MDYDLNIPRFSRTLRGFRFCCHFGGSRFVGESNLFSDFVFSGGVNQCAIFECYQDRITSLGASQFIISNVVDGS